MKFFEQKKKEKIWENFPLFFSQKKEHTRERDQQLFLLLLSFNDFDVNEEEEEEEETII